MDSFILGAVAAIAGSFLSLGFESFKLFEKTKGKMPSLEEKIEQLSQALKKSSTIIADMEKEISSRRKLVEKMSSDAERHQNLMSLNKEQVDAVASALRTEVVTESKKSFWKSVLVNFAFFAAGIGFSYLSVIIGLKR